jgi:hypothetical protein
MYTTINLTTWPVSRINNCRKGPNHVATGLENMLQISGSRYVNHTSFHKISPEASHNRQKKGSHSRGDQQLYTVTEMIASHLNRDKSFSE